MVRSSRQISVVVIEWALNSSDSLRMCLNISFVYVPVTDCLTPNVNLKSIRRTNNNNKKGICSGCCLTPPTPQSHPPWSVCLWSLFLIKNQVSVVSAFLVHWKVCGALWKKKMVRSFLKSCAGLCVYACICGWLCERACIGGCVYVLEWDGIPFVLGVNPLRLLWRFLKGISWGHKWWWWGVRRQLFTCLGSQLSILKLGVCVWFQNRGYMYTATCKVMPSSWSRLRVGLQAFFQHQFPQLNVQRTVFSKCIFFIIGGFLITLFIFAYLYHVIFF